MVRHRRQQILDIRTGGKRPVTRAGDDRHPERRVVAKPRAGLAERLHLIAVEGVERLRPIERDRADLAVNLEIDRHCCLLLLDASTTLAR